MTKTAMLGMGAMGSRMAQSLLAAGHEAAVWNRTGARAAALAESGGRVADTPAAAVAGCEIAISMVRDDEASRRVWLDPTDGGLAAMPAGAIAIESATVTPAWARELAAVCAARGVRFLDAPVAGSRPQAAAGKLIFLAGGDAGTLTAAEPVLSAMGGAAHHAGPAGAGAALKLAVNALFGVQVAAMAELLGMLERCGLDPERAVDILGATPLCSPAAKMAAGAMLAGQFAPLFPIELVEKDFGYAVATAAARGADVPLATATREVYQKAMHAGHDGDNITGVAQRYLGAPASVPAKG